MKRMMTGAVSAILMISACAFAANEAAPSPVPVAKSIAIVAMGPVEQAMVDRVLAFAKENSSLVIRLLPSLEATGDTLDDIAVAGAKAMGADDAAVIVLANPSADIKPHGIFQPEQRVAVVNVKSLKPADGDAETWGRRIEREVMQSIGMLVGAPPCPNPQCAMWQYTTDEELDAKGRNYCPPCMGVVQEAAKGKGVGVEPGGFMVP